MRQTLLAALVTIALTACGGGGGSSTATTVPDTPAGNNTTTATPQEQFPTGVTVGTPADLAASASVAQLSIEPATVRRQVIGAWQAIRTAFATGDYARIATILAPLPRAIAAPSRLPEGARNEAIVDAILAGTEAPGTHIHWAHLSAVYANANCFGPQIEYSDHPDGGGGSGTLPTGDLGMWTEDSVDGGVTRPCSVAQLRQLARARKERAQAGMLIAAAMRNAVRTSALAMPASGASLDIATPMRAVVQAAIPTGEVEAAVISRDASTITYRLRVNDPAASQRVEVLMKHRPDGSASKHGGVMLITVSRRHNDPAFGCADQMDGADYKVSWVQSVRYGRHGNDVHFSAREARYCGHGNTAEENLAASIAALTEHFELDPVVALAGNTRGVSKGWRGNFSRYAGTYDRRDHAGHFAYAWQAGANDSHSRQFAVHSSYESVAELRTLKTFFGFAPPIQSTNGVILGMICNWAGPGNTHTPLDLFQRQDAMLETTDTEWVRGVSYVRYAPTNSCNASATMEFDVDNSGAIDGTEGNGVTNALDGKGAHATVGAAIGATGFVVPGLF